ncbi:MAG: ribonucleotide reductase N-terminal alpha domain-containing protein [Sulfurovum sp.]
MVRVVKRSGRVETLDVGKIQKYTSEAVEGLERVSQSELEVDAKLQFRDMISSEEIQQTLIKTAVDKIDIDRPDWTFVASRLFLYDIYHKVTGFTGYNHLREHFERGEKEGRIVLGLKDKYDLDDLNDYIKPERDLQFTYLGIRTLYDRYLIKDKDGIPIELPQQLFMGVAMFLAQNEFDSQTWAKKFYDILSKFEVMAATPTLSNARTPRHQLSSCYIGSTPDNIEGIFDAFKEMALLSKFGGGIGWDWSLVRGMGSFIDGHKHAAGGIVPFLKIVNDVAIAVDQLGCVSQNSFVKVLYSVTTDNFEHDFRRVYQKADFTPKELQEAIASYASSFAFEYARFSKNFISSLFFDYIMNQQGHDFLENTYGLTHEQYKRIIGKYKKLNKGLPEGFETIIDHWDYAISKEGVIIKIDSLRVLSNTIDRKGYVRVALGKHSLTLHLLLAKQYLDYSSKHTIDHKDSNKLNNSLDNLQILSNEKNISKGWEESYKKRTEMARIRKHLSYGYKLQGKRRDTHKFKIKALNTLTIPIEDVRIGDLIMSYNIDTNIVDYQSVTAKHKIDVKAKDQLQIAFEDENFIITSNWHPFPKVVNNEVIYVRSDSLEMGDITINDKNDKVKISAISKPDVAEGFIDLTVKNNNNYFCSTENNEGNFHLIHNTRKGAIAVYIEPWHMDIRDFLDLKKNSGEERRRAHDLFPAIWLNDLFMRRVEADEMWTLFDPYEVSELTTLYGEEFEARYIELESSDDKITRDKVSAKGLWKEMLRSYFETGNPFLTFKDTANRANPNRHTGVIRSSNLCVTGDTKVLTKKYGYIKIKKVAGKTLECWNGEEWSKTELFQTSESQKVLKVNLSSQQTIEATPYHKWSVVCQDKYGANIGEIIKRTHELKAGDKLSKFELEPIPHGTKKLKFAYENGFYSADGTVVKNNSIIGTKIYLYHAKRDLLNFFSGYKRLNRADKMISLHYEHGALKKKFFIPNHKYSVQSRLDWLAGYIDGDGTLTSNKSAESIQIASTNNDFLFEIRLMLQELGIYSIVSHFKDEGYRLMPKNDGSGESKEYWCKKQTRLLIAGSSLNKLIDLGYSGHRVQPMKRKYNRSAVRFVKVESVIDNNESKATYCGTEPKRSKMMFDGVMTLQCTEIFQNTSPNTYKIQFTFDDGSIEAYDENEMITVGNGTTKPARKITALDTINGKQIWVVDKEKSDGDTAVCNLASVNLSKINTREDLARVVPIAMRMLDNVIDLNFYPLAKVKKTNEKSRSVGLGVMGEAQMLAENKIEWGSDKHFTKIDEVMESFSYYAIEASSNLALEKGKYPTFEGSDWSNGIFPIDKANPNACKLVDRGGLFGYTHDWFALREKVKTDGMRNGYLMAIAPTSSISILTGTTQAIEPVYKRKWFEENLSGLIPVVAPNLSADTWQYYTPSYDLNQNLLIKAGAIRQKWIDQGQSLNIFITLDKASGKYLNEIYMNAWKFGLKSTYYLRSQSPESANDVEDRSQECVGCQ